LDFLVSAGLVEKMGVRYVTSERNIHLGRNHAMTAKHHINWKLKSIESISVPEENAIRYSGVVTLSRADAEKMKEIILRSLEQTRTLVRNSNEEILGCYSFEFFEVGNPSGRRI